MNVEAEWKKLPRLDKELVEFLKKKYPPIELKNLSKEEYYLKGAMQAGASEVITTIHRIIELQNKAR